MRHDKGIYDKRAGGVDRTGYFIRTAGGGMLQLLYMEYPADPKGHSFAEAAKQRSAYTGWRSGGQLRVL